MKKLTAVALVCLLAACSAYAGPIKGLVDVGTGREVPDADARYMRIGITNSYGAFTNLDVLVTASNGTQVVNYQALSNYVATHTAALPSNLVYSGSFTNSGTTFSNLYVLISGTGTYDVVNWYALTNYVGSHSSLLPSNLVFSTSNNIYAAGTTQSVPNVIAGYGMFTNLDVFVAATSGVMAVNWYALTNYVGSHSSLLPSNLIFSTSNNMYAVGTTQSMPYLSVSNGLWLFGVAITNVDTNLVLYADGSQPLTADWNVGGFAMTNLGTLLPSGSNTIDLGSAALPWRYGYFASTIQMGSGIAGAGNITATNTGVAIGSSDTTKAKFYVNGEAGPYTNKPLVLLNRSSTATGPILQWGVNGSTNGYIDVNGNILFTPNTTQYCQNVIVSNSFLPFTSNTTDIGSAALPFRHGYFGGSTIYMNGQPILGYTNGSVLIRGDFDTGYVKITGTNVNGALSIQNDAGQNHILLSGYTNSYANIARPGTTGGIAIRGGNDWNKGAVLYLNGNDFGAALDKGSMQSTVGNTNSSYQWYDYTGSTLLMGLDNLNVSSPGYGFVLKSPSTGGKVLQSRYTGGGRLEVYDGSAGNVLLFSVSNALVNLCGNPITNVASIYPAASNTYDIGSATMPFRDLYLGTSSVYMAGLKMLSYSNNQLVAGAQLVNSSGVSYGTGDLKRSTADALYASNAIVAKLDGGNILTGTQMIHANNEDTGYAMQYLTTPLTGIAQLSLNWYGVQKYPCLVMGSGTWPSGTFYQDYFWYSPNQFNFSTNVAAPVFKENNTNLVDKYISLDGNQTITGQKTFSQTILPATSNAIDLGSATMPFCQGYFGSNSVYLGDYQVTKAKQQNYDTAYTSTTNAQSFTLMIQDPTNGLAYWMANPYGIRSCTLVEAYVKSQGMTGTVNIVSQHRSSEWYTYDSITNGIATGTAQTSFTGSTTLTNGTMIGFVPGNISTFAATNMLRVDFLIRCL